MKRRQRELFASPFDQIVLIIVTGHNNLLNIINGKKALSIHVNQPTPAYYNIINMNNPFCVLKDIKIVK